jgi:hypothetical protein
MSKQWLICPLLMLSLLLYPFKKIKFDHSYGHNITSKVCSMTYWPFRKEEVHISTTSISSSNVFFPFVPTYNHWNLISLCYFFSWLCFRNMWHILLVHCWLIQDVVPSPLKHNQIHHFLIPLGLASKKYVLPQKIGFS